MLNLMLANRNLDLNKKDRFGVNAFWIASFYSKVEFMDLLRTHGADMYATNQHGSNALHIAVKRWNSDIVRHLCRVCEYKLDLPKHNGVTAFGIAAYKGFTGMMQELLSAGANMNYLNANGITPMYLAIKSN
jgi:ankyrin repeat protein